MKSWFWRHFGDPLILRIAARMEHQRQLQGSTHSGVSWGRLATLGRDVVIHREASLINEGSVESVAIGDNCHLYGHIWILGAGRLSIGHHSFLGPRSHVWCAESVRIGSYSLISHDVEIHDSDSHAISADARRREIVARCEHGDYSMKQGVANAAVTIEDDVWIGFKSSILKGVTVGRGAIVAAGSVVTKDVAPFTMVGGNPARVIKELPR